MNTILYPLRQNISISGNYWLLKICFISLFARLVVLVTSASIVFKIGIIFGFLQFEVLLELVDFVLEYRKIEKIEKIAKYWNLSIY